MKKCLDCNKLFERKNAEVCLPCSELRRKEKQSQFRKKKIIEDTHDFLDELQNPSFLEDTELEGIDLDPRVLEWMDAVNDLVNFLIEHLEENGGLKYLSPEELLLLLVKIQGLDLRNA